MTSYQDNSVYVLNPLLPILSIDSMFAPTENGECEQFDIADPSIDIEKGLDTARISEAVRDFVRRLPSKQQDLINRIFWDGESPAAVARAMGVSNAAISKALAKIFNKGRQALTPLHNSTASTFH